MLEQCTWCQKKPHRETQASWLSFTQAVGGQLETERGFLVPVPLKLTSEPIAPSQPLCLLCFCLFSNQSLSRHINGRFYNKISMFMQMYDSMRIFNFGILILKWVFTCTAMQRREKNDLGLKFGFILAVCTYFAV